MSLTGNLEIFPMPEVLRLLSRSKKTGCLRVDNGMLDGRVYLDGGAISFANTEDDDRVRRALVNAGLVTEDGLRSVAGTDTPITEKLAEGVDSSAVTDFVRELVVESLYRIRKPGVGEFEFAVDQAPVFRTGQQFDTEVAVAESDRRAAEWADVLSVISDLDAPVRMVRSLPDENSVTIAAPTWEVLASLEGGTSTRQLSERTGLSEFRAARELSGLVRSELVEIVPERVPSDDGYRPPVIERTPIVERAEEDEPDVSESAWDDAGWEAPEETVEQEQPAEAPSGDWFAEAAGETGEWGEDASTFEAPDDVADDTGDTDDAEEAEEPAADRGWWATAVESPEETSGDESTDDTDSFLESVFSQLNDVSDESEEAESDEHDDETGFSMGLLRRRRMGTAARDLTND